jgi:hypothetical protein
MHWGVKSLCCKKQWEDPKGGEKSHDTVTLKDHFTRLNLPANGMVASVYMLRLPQNSPFNL